MSCGLVVEFWIGVVTRFGEKNMAQLPLVNMGINLRGRVQKLALPRVDR